MKVACEESQAVPRKFRIGERLRCAVDLRQLQRGVVYIVDDLNHTHFDEVYIYREDDPVRQRAATHSWCVERFERCPIET